MHKILIVDDSQLMRKVLKEICESVPGVTVFEATNGQEAIDIYQKEQPGLVFLDIIMPDVSGIDVLKQIGNSAKVIIVSAIGQDAMIGAAKKAGAKDYIVKPFEKEVVLKKIEKYLS